MEECNNWLIFEKYSSVYCDIRIESKNGNQKPAKGHMGNFLQEEMENR